MYLISSPTYATAGYKFASRPEAHDTPGKQAHRTLLIYTPTPTILYKPIIFQCILPLTVISKDHFNLSKRVVRKIGVARGAVANEACSA